LAGDLQRRQANRKYGKSDKGRATAERYRTTEKARATAARHRQTDRYKRRMEVYSKSATVKESQRRYYKTIRGRAIAIFREAKYRARRKGLPFTITKQMIENRISNLTCSITGDTLNLKTFKRYTNPFGPSLDQRVPGKGYTPKNSQIVSVWYNRFKNNLTDKQATAILRMTRQYGDK